MNPYTLTTFTPEALEGEPNGQRMLDLNRRYQLALAQEMQDIDRALATTEINRQRIREAWRQHSRRLRARLGHVQPEKTGPVRFFVDHHGQVRL